MTPALDLETLELLAGSHKKNDDKKMCVMEAVAYVAGEPWSDHPVCASKVIAAFCRNWNDCLDDVTRQKLKPYIPKIIGTMKDEATEEKLAWMATDWLARVCAPEFLELSPNLRVHAKALRALPRLTAKTIMKAQPVLNEARAAGAAAWAAAGAAAWDAAGAAAGDAAGAAAWDAARDAAWAAVRAAAWDAARDAAWDAAGDAARDAAREKLVPTVKKLQKSAFQLLDKMIRTTKNQE